MIVFRWISIFAVSLSLFSLVEKFANFGLAPNLQAILRLYRAALYPLGEKLKDILQWLFANYHVDVPSPPLEFIVLYILLSLAIVRFTYKLQEPLRKQFGPVPVAVLLLPLTLIWPLFLVGNVFVLCVWPKAGVSNILFGWDIELAKVIGVCLFLFGANAYLLA